VSERPWFPYVVVPMARTVDHTSLLEPGFAPVAREEPQIAFRRDAAAVFDEEHYYSRRPKIELLWRLGVPGPWDDWAIEPWDLPYPAYAAEAGAWQRAGWVARLPSGKPQLEVGLGSQTRRLSVRAEALNGFLMDLDARLAKDRLSSGEPLLGLPYETAHAAALLARVSAELPGRATRSTLRTRARARRLFMRADLPAAVDASVDADAQSDLRRLLRWLLRDAGSRAVRMETDLAAIRGELLLAVTAARAGAWTTLQETLIRCADRATVVFQSDPATRERTLADDAHREVWDAIDRLAVCAGQTIWAHGERPAVWSRETHDATSRPSHRSHLNRP
ncbi:MAG: hypothetical protein ACOC2Q_01835, partial [Spirochaetota bacterium]